MTKKKVSITEEFDPFAFRPDSPTPPPIKKPRKVPASRRGKLPLGLSYHPTPQGLKYRIRIRSEKKYTALGFKKPVDEIYDDLSLAESRLVQLKYKRDEVKSSNDKKFIQESIALAKNVTIGSLCDEHYRKYYSLLKSAKEHKSRMKVICDTLVPSEDSRIFMWLQLRYDGVKPDSHRIPFGAVPVLEYEKYLVAYIDERKKKVKNQTIVNDLMFLHTALKNCHNYFRNIPQIHNPLKTVNFKTLKDQTVYTDKRLKPETRVQIEQILIANSRESHYADFFVFLSETGCRLSEALTIRVQDVDLSKSIIFLISKKNEKPRYLPITQKLRQTVQERIKGKNLTDLLFPYSKHTYQTKLKNIKRHLDGAGIKFSWHMLRHTFISNNIDNKNVFQLMNELDITNYQHFQERYLNEIEAEKTAVKLAQAKLLTPQEVKQVVGHSSLEVTGTYTHDKIPSAEESLKRENEELKAMLLHLLKQQDRSPKIVSEN